VGFFSEDAVKTFSTEVRFHGGRERAWALAEVSCKSMLAAVINTRCTKMSVTMDPVKMP
jgi:hypothetical protein